MSDDLTYRNALVAARSRIADLEARLSEHAAAAAEDRQVAALLRERAVAAAARTPRNVWAMLPWMFVVFAVAAIAFAYEGDWIVGGLALATPVLMGLVGQRIANGSAAASVKQTALIDERLAAIAAAKAAGRG